jgi:hypothetical protein
VVSGTTERGHEMEVPVTFRVTKFLRGVLEATRDGKVEWESTADPRVLLASLPDESVLRLAEVPDFDGIAPEPDYVLSLLRDGNELMSLDRRSFCEHDAQVSLGVTSNVEVYRLFLDLWRNAVLKARRVAEVLDSVNALLAKLNAEPPF